MMWRLFAGLTSTGGARYRGLYEFGPGRIEPYDYAFELACIDYDCWSDRTPEEIEKEESLSAEEAYDLYCAEREPFLDYYAELV